MELVEVDVVGLESPEAGFAAFDDVESAGSNGVRLVGHSAVYLGCEKHVVTFSVALKRLANELFRCAFAVDVRGVEEVNSLAEGVVDDFACVFKVGLLSEHHAAQNEGADVHAGASEEFVFHGAFDCRCRDCLP